MRPAARLVKLARSFQSSVLLRVNQRVANARSILAILLLAASCGSVIDLEASGTDEDQAIAAMRSVFDVDDLDSMDVETVTDTDGELRIRRNPELS